MRPVSSRRAVGVLLLSVLLLLAGCSGGGGDATPTEAPETTTEATPAETETPTATPTATATETPTPTPVDSDEGDGEYQFEPGESYVYEGDDGEQQVAMRWYVPSVGDRRIAVNVTLVSPRGGGQETIRTTRQDVYEDVIADETPGFPFLFVRLPVLAVGDNDLREGNSWTVEGEEIAIGGDSIVSWETATVEVTGTEFIQGNICYTIEVRHGEGGFDSCVRDDWPFALRTNTSETVYEIRGVRRPGR